MKARDPLAAWVLCVLAAALILGALSMPGAAAAEAPAAPGVEPAAPVSTRPAGPVVEASEVLQVADAVAQSLATSGRIPTGVAVTLSDGKREAWPAARAFALLARFLGNGYEDGITPEYVPLPPQMSGPPEGAEAADGASGERAVATEDVLAQTRATADIAESTAHLPAAVWVAGVRFTPAQFMGAMAVVLQYALYNGEVPEQVVIGEYLPPLDWAGVSSPGAGPPPEPFPPQPLAPASTPGYPDYGAGAEEPAAEVPLAPQITLYLPAEGQLSGEKSLVIEYQGPPAFIRLSIDGTGKAVSNMTHFTYPWDTRLEPDGAHTLQVTAVNRSDDILDRVEATVETANGNLPLR